MKTKELIKKLQEEDPSGDLHVSVMGMPILGVESMPGYYDGPGMYFEDNRKYFPEKMFIDYKNYKLSIRCLEGTDDFIWDHDGDFSGIEIIGADDKKVEEWVDSFKKSAADFKAFDEESSPKFLHRIMGKIKEGHSLIQDSDKKYFISFCDEEKFEFNPQTIEQLKRHQCSTKVEQKFGIKHLCQGEAKVVVKSGFFKSVSLENGFNKIELDL